MVQVLVAIIAAAGAPFVTWFLSRLDRKRDEQDGATSGENTTLPRGAENRVYGDLALYLGCAAGFCVLLADSTLISGRSPTLSLSTLLLPSLMSLVMGSAVYYAWRAGRGELILGLLALSSTVVLLLSAGGPFRRAENEGAPVLPLLVPLFILTTLMSTALLHFWGRPIFQKQRRRWIVVALLAILAVGGAVSAGVEHTRAVAEDAQNPAKGLGQESLGRVTALLDRLRDNLTPTQRAQFYRFASESALNATYADFYFTVSSDLESQSIPSQPTSRPAPGQSELRARTARRTRGTRSGTRPRR
jgi:hypothetical protein